MPRTGYEGPISNDGYFLYVGNVEKRKGVDILIDAFDKYVQKGGKKNLIIAGKKREDDVDEMLSKLLSKHPDRVTYKGYVTDEEKQSLYAHADTVLFQSRAEGFGICALEAMDFGKPVLASDLSIFSEIVGDAISYFPLSGGADALSEAMLSENIPVDQGKYEKTMNRYLPETLVPQLIRVFHEIGTEKI